jgi:hypothetical protein
VECPKAKAVCMQCAGEHGTEKCNKPYDLKCTNCSSTDHGAADRDCPKFTQSIKDYRKQNPGSTYRFYPVADDQLTWELTPEIKTTYRAERGPIRQQQQPETEQPTAGKEGEGEERDEGDREEVDEEEEDLGPPMLGLLKPASNWGDSVLKLKEMIRMSPNLIT